MFLFVVGLVDYIMLQGVDDFVKQTSKLEKVPIKLGSRLQNCKFFFECQGRMLIKAA